jgi:hypothetical protein
MKHFLLGIGTFALIFVVMFGLVELFETLQISKETTQIIFMVLALSLIAKPFGELTVSVFKLNK